MSDQALRRLHILSDQISPPQDPPYSLFAFGFKGNGEVFAFYNALLQALRLPCDFRPQASESLSEVLQVLRTRSCLGVCLEGQFRAAILPLVDVVDPEIREIGNVDLVVKRGNQLIGVNTQLLALLSILGSASELNLRRNAVIMGCGEFCKVALCALRHIGLLDITIFSDSLPLLRKLPWARKTTLSSSLELVDIAIICEANQPVPPLHAHALVLDLTESEGHWERECWFYGAEDLRTWRLWHQARELAGAHVELDWVRAHK